MLAVDFTGIFGQNEHITCADDPNRAVFEYTSNWQNYNWRLH